MEEGIAENVLEMALRGEPREPLDMVGRMEGQSVVLRAGKGCWVANYFDLNFLINLNSW